MRRLLFASVLMAVGSAWAFAYDVRQPSNDIRPRYRGASAGEWTLDVSSALAGAKAEGRYTLLLNTGSWWCPFCETMEDLVLTSDAWKKFVADYGFYLAMMDFPYRGEVPKDQVSQSWHPELGAGWGFKCWLMSPEYLADNGLTSEQGLDAIMAQYEMQKALAPEGASPVVISNWTQTAEFRYGKVGYPTVIIFNDEGVELGRVSFPWYSKSSVTAEEAQQYLFQQIEAVIIGGCSLCKEPLAGTPKTDRAQIYNGWLTGDDGIVGTVFFHTTKMSRRGDLKVSGSAVVNGRKLNFVSERIVDPHLEVTLSIKGSYEVAVVQFGETGLTGSVAGYRIAGGGRNVFKAVDEKAKERRGMMPTGVWSVVMASTDDVTSSEFARGYGTLAVKMLKSGKATVSGRLADGTKISGTSQAIVGEEGMACIPIYMPLKSKTGSFGFVMWFKNGRLLGFGDVAPWYSAERDLFVASYRPSSSAYAGVDSVPSELELTVIGLDGESSFDTVEATARRWLGTEATNFKATVTKSTGLMTGTMKLDIDGRRVSGRFYGIIMGGSGYGTVLVPSLGSWAVKISVCGGCSD